MRTRITSALLALTIFAGTLAAQTGSGLGGGQPGQPMSGTNPMSVPKKPEPGSLEDLLDKALRQNADIRAAEAKVREAEAELNRVRHQVLAKVVSLRNDIDA